MLIGRRELRGRSCLMCWLALAISAVVVMDGCAYAQSAPWQIQITDDQTVVASLAMDHPTSSGKVVTLLNIGFGTRNRCRAEIGIAMLRDGGYGDTVGKVSPPNTEPVSLTIDQITIRTPAPFFVKYQNGFEVLFPADQSMIDMLSNGSVAITQIVSDTPKLEFPLAGGRAAIAEAKQRCTEHH